MPTRPGEVEGTAQPPPGSPAPARTGPDRTGPDRTGPDRTGPDRTGPDRTGDIAVGRIGPARGVRGDLFVEPWTDDPQARFAVGAVLRTEPADAGPLTVQTASTASGKLVVHFAAVDDRPAAEALRGVRLVIAAAELPPLPDPDEFYASDLVGLAAVTVQGDDLGLVRDVVDIGGADYLVLELDGRERLVPFVAAVVPTVDMSARRAVIDPPEGLFDL